MLKKAMELDPTWPYSFFNLAILYNLNGRWTEAKPLMQYVLDKFADHPDYPHFKSMYQNMLEQHNESQ